MDSSFIRDTNKILGSYALRLQDEIFDYDVDRSLHQHKLTRGVEVEVGNDGDELSDNVSIRSNATDQSSASQLSINGNFSSFTELSAPYTDLVATSNDGEKVELGKHVTTITSPRGAPQRADSHKAGSRFAMLNNQTHSEGAIGDPVPAPTASVDNPPASLFALFHAQPQLETTDANVTRISSETKVENTKCEPKMSDGGPVTSAQVNPLFAACSSVVEKPPASLFEIIGNQGQPGSSLVRDGETPSSKNPDKPLGSLFDMVNTGRSQTVGSVSNNGVSPLHDADKPKGTLFGLINQPSPNPQENGFNAASPMPAGPQNMDPAPVAASNNPGSNPTNGSNGNDSNDFFEKIRVLIAEDNLINQKVLTRTLKRIGIKYIEIVDNGQKAVDAHASKEKDFDLILMDLQMPIMDGLEATRIITTRKRAANTEYPKIVFLTAHALSDYRKKADDVGGDAFISKPFKLEIIKGLILGYQDGMLKNRNRKLN